MKAEVKIDNEVVSQVLLEFNVHRNDVDFDKLSAYLKLRYLHYQRVVVIKEMSQVEFKRGILVALESDLREYFTSKFVLTAEEDAIATRRMQMHYRFLTKATPEEHAAANLMIHKLPQYDQEVLHLLRDGLTQAEIVKAIGMHYRGAEMYVRELKTIYDQIKGK